MQISEADLRLDLRFQRLHDRKYLLRAIESLKRSCITFITVKYACEIIKIRIKDPSQYDFCQLSHDCALILSLDEDEVILSDRHGNVLGSGNVSIIFNSEMNQVESVYLSTLSLDEAPSLDSEDFNEDNIHHNCEVDLDRKSHEKTSTPQKDLKFLSIERPTSSSSTRFS